MKKWILPLLLAVVLCMNFMPVRVKADSPSVEYLYYDLTTGQMLSDTQDCVNMTDMLIYYPAQALIPMGSDNLSTFFLVNDNITINKHINIFGDVHLILKDGCTLTVTADMSIAADSSLTIYGQTEGTGRLNMSTSSGTPVDGEGTSAFIVEGGEVTITAPQGCSAIFSISSSFSVELNHGSLNVTGGANAPALGAGLADGYNVTVRGGSLTAIGGENGAGIGGGNGGKGGNFTITGGTVTAIGGAGGAGIGAGKDGSSQGSFSMDDSMYAKAGADAASAVVVSDYATSREQYVKIAVQPWKLLQNAIQNDVDFDCDEFSYIKTGSSSALIEIKKDIVCYNNSLGPIAIYSGRNVALRLNGHKIDRAVGNTPIDGGCVISNNGTLTIYDDANAGKITGGNSLLAGGGIYNNGTLGLALATVDGNKAQNGAGIYNTGTVILAGGVVSNNTATAGGGGIYNNGGRIQTNYINNKITGNSAANGAGIYNISGNVSLSSTELSNNTASSKGGAILTNSFVGFSGSKILNCTADIGGGVAVLGAALDGMSRFEAVGGEIKDCSATGTNGNGGAVYVFGNGVATFGNNIKISDCTAANNGGAIYSEGVLGITNCTITENTATNGNGSGIYLAGSGRAFVGQAPKVTGNKKGTADNNLYVANGGLITIGTGADVPAPSTGMSVGITLQSGTEFVTNDATGCEGYFTSDNSAYGIKLTSGNNLQLALKYTVSFNMAGRGEQVESQNVVSGNTATEPAEPTAEGYTFIEWCLDTTEKPAYDFDTPVIADVSLIAVWKKNITVTFNMDGHGEQVNAQDLLEGDTVDKPNDPSAEGYKFVGWCINTDTKPEFDFETVLTDDIELIAKWEALDPLPPTGDSNVVFVLVSIILVMCCAALTTEKIINKKVG